MTVPFSLHFSAWDQVLLSAGTAKRLLLACGLGAAVGFERELRNKANGLRTNILMCMGCAFFTLLSASLAGEGNPDKGRVAANIVTGVGFLGAGLILHTRSRVLGLTSAATVFVVAAIGMACGAGLYLEAVLATVLVLLSLQVIGMLEGQASWKHYMLLYEVRGDAHPPMVPAILGVLDKAGIRMSVVERDTFGSLERVVFPVTANRRMHAQLLAELRASDLTDSVMAFRDSEQD